MAFFIKKKNNNKNPCLLHSVSASSNNLRSFPDEEIKLIQVKQQVTQNQVFKPRIYLSTKMTHHYLHHENLPERLKRKHCNSYKLLGKLGLKIFYNKTKTIILHGLVLFIV